MTPLVVTSLDVASRREQEMHARDRASSRAFSARLLRKRARSQRAPANSREIAGLLRCVLAPKSRVRREFAASSPRARVFARSRTSSRERARTQRAACEQPAISREFASGFCEVQASKRARNARAAHCPHIRPSINLCESPTPPPFTRPSGREARISGRPPLTTRKALLAVVIARFRALLAPPRAFSRHPATLRRALLIRAAVTLQFKV